MLAALMFFLAVPYAGWVFLALALLPAALIPIAWFDCRRKAGLSDHSGETCPQCGAQNVIRPWSF